MNKAMFKDKKFCILGDRDGIPGPGIPGPAISECVKDLGGEVVFASTECFV